MTVNHKKNLLDAAENLFAERGYFGTSMRQVTGLASAPHGLATYHFKSKDDLFLQVVDRRLGGIIELLNYNLDTAERARQLRPPVVEIIGAYISAHLQFAARGPGEMSYLRLTQQLVALGKRRGLLEDLGQKAQPVMDRYISMLARAVPSGDPVEITAAFHLMRLSLAGLLVDTDLPIAIDLRDIRGTAASFAAYCSAGFEAFVGRPKAAQAV
jgi:AcrR family transcriptional regulator